MGTFWGGGGGVKQQKHEADHTPPASAMSRKRGPMHPLPSMLSWHSA
jgi:hypothetical protein